MTERDRMSLMRHWLLYDNADPPRVTVIREPETAAQAQELGRYIEGPFVPEQPRGAVDDREELARLLDRAIATGKLPDGPEWEALKIASHALNRHRGQ